MVYRPSGPVVVLMQPAGSSWMQMDTKAPAIGAAVLTSVTVPCATGPEARVDRRGDHRDGVGRAVLVVAGGLEGEGAGEAEAELVPGERVPAGAVGEGAAARRGDAHPGERRRRRLVGDRALQHHV